MSHSHSLNSLPLLEAERRLPWQYRAHPTLFVTVCSVVGVLTVVGLLAATRRFLGAFTGALSPSMMLLLAFVAAAAVAFARIAWRRNFPLESPEELSRLDIAIGWASSLSLILLMVGCCYPGYKTTDWLIWLPIIVADQFWRQTFFDTGEPWAGEESFEAEFSDSPNLAIAQYPQDENLLQQLYRLKDEQGQEIIYGTVKADFVTDQRTAVVHVGFCPPLSYLPEIEAEALPGSFARTKVVQSLAHGTRLEVRLASPAENDLSLWIDMAARPVGAQAKVESA